MIYFSLNFSSLLEDKNLMQPENYGKLFRQNHWSWVPTYKNEYGIMSWLLNQTKEY